jgi:hypothetical protein
MYVCMYVYVYVYIRICAMIAREQIDGICVSTCIYVCACIALIHASS